MKTNFLFPVKRCRGVRNFQLGCVFHKVLDGRLKVENYPSTDGCNQISTVNLF